MSQEINSIIHGFQQEYQCSKCKNIQKVNLFPYINFSLNPEYYALVKDLSIFKVVCDKCGKTEYIKFDCLIVDEEHKYFLYFLSNKDNFNKFKYQITYFIETTLNKDGKYNLDDYKTRTIFNANDLIEKMAIFELGLNDEAIELIKSMAFEKELINPVVYDSLYFDDLDKTNLKFVAFSEKSSSIEPKQFILDFNFYNNVIDKIKNINVRHKEYFEVIDQNWVNSHFSLNENDK